MLLVEHERVTRELYRHTLELVGYRTATCSNPGVFGPVGTEVYCSHEVQAAAGGGDSGGPVYSWQFPLTPDGRGANGIVHGVYTPGPGEDYLYYFSPWSLIRAELGYSSLYPGN